MELLEEDNSIYSIYLKGEDYEKILQEKNNRLLKEEEERKNAERKSFNFDNPFRSGDSTNKVGDNDNNEIDDLKLFKLRNPFDAEVNE